MASCARGHLPAGIYHVGTRSAGPIELFGDDFDRTMFCNLLVRRLRRSSWSCLAFCLMSTHYHLLLAAPDDGLQQGMRCLNGHYAYAFNRRHGRSGHLFGGRYFALPVLTDTSLRQRFRYLALNPVRAKVCTSPLDWTWSSYRDAATGSRTFAFVDHTKVIDAFGGDWIEAAAFMREYVEELEDAPEDGLAA
jgi:putative transposase